MTNDQLMRVVDSLQWDVHRLTERVAALEAGKLGGPTPPKYVPAEPSLPAFVPVNAGQPTELPEVNLDAPTLVGQRN